MGSQLGVSNAKILALGDYATSPLYDEAERVALEYADAMTITGREVSDDLFARLRRVYDDDALVELTAIIAWENASSKFNRALRIPSQGLWPGARDLETLRDLNRNYIRSVRVSDVRWFDENLAEDFLNSNPDGSLVDRAGFLAHIARLGPVANLEVEDVRIRMLGELAIIHARTTYTKPDGQAGAGRYTDAWARRQGRWLCVAAHVTRG